MHHEQTIAEARSLVHRMGHHHRRQILARYDLLGPADNLVREMTNFNAAGWFGLPQADWPGIEMRFQADHWPVFIAFLIATVAGTIETVGDVVAVQKVSKRNFRKVDYDSVQGALYADGVGNFLAGLAGTTPNTTYSTRISVLALARP